MDLLEYQAKELFHQVGIPILRSQPIANPSELKRLQIPYPVVLKSQVRAGGRGRAGGIRFVENTIDAIAAAQSIFNLPILGEYPEVILAEARYNTQEEFFLAVLLDYQLQRPVLLGSAKGGMEVETLLKHIKRVVLEEEFSPFQARHLALKMGLQGKLILSVSAIIEKMYQLFAEKDLDLIEINPLAVGAEGEIMALDGKITVNDAAIARHPDLLTFTMTKDAQLPDRAHWIGKLEPTTNTVIVSNSVGLILSAWDLLVQENYHNVCGIVVENHPNASIFAEQLLQSLTAIIDCPHLKSILVNIIAEAEMSEAVAQVVVNHRQSLLKQHSEDRLPRATAASSSGRKSSKRSRARPPVSAFSPALVIRLVSGNLDPITEPLTGLPIDWTDSLEQAIATVVSLAK